MRERMIINARGELGWRHRLLSDVLTACLWMGWVLLWIPVFRKLHAVIRLHLNFEPAAREVLDTVTPISIEHSLIALIGTSGLLMLWSLLPKRSVIHAHATLSTADYARHFAIPEQEIRGGLDARICVVSHEDDGTITGIVVRN